MRELRKDRMVEARRKLAEAKALNPMQAQVLRALGLVAEGAAKQQSGRDAEALVLDGQRLSAEGEDAKAAAAFAAALQASPGLKAAEEGLSLVQARNAAKVQAACDKGSAALGRRDWSAAEDAYTLALSLDPRHAGAQSGQAKARAAQADERGLASQRREADRLYNSGVEAWQGGNLALAASRFRETLAVAPGDAEAAKALQAVRRKLDERAEKDRQDAAALLAEGRTLEQRGALDEALRRYERAAAKDPGLAEAAKAKSSLEKKVKGL
jgi:tetratricopeptide (TPR) repeat protein